jgi:hypothetical protein
LSWGWRIPFLLSFFVLVVAYLVRRNMPETPVFTEIRQKHEVARFPVLVLLRDYWNRGKSSLHIPARRR